VASLVTPLNYLEQVEPLCSPSLTLLTPQACHLIAHLDDSSLPLSA
jgi:hypothetical protein